MDFGLARVEAVRAALDLRLRCPVITVGGTNGKGSTCALLEGVLRCAGFHVGCYTSPHLLRYNERVRIDATQADDARLVDAFTRIERARGDVSLTYFEFGTLAAAMLFDDARVDAAVLEVGLGGRLDAVNIFDADCAVVTSIGLDHMDYLGDTRDAIAVEKAGIFRAGRHAVIGDPDPPPALLQQAAAIGAQVRLIDRDYGYKASEGSWTYWSVSGRRSGLPLPALRGEHQLLNAATALNALDELREALPVDMGAIRRALVEVELPGRFQVLPGRPATVLDVAHNAHAAQRLRDTLRRLPATGRCLAVFAMLRDKDIGALVEVMRADIDRWYIAPLPGARGADAGMLRAMLQAGGVRADAIVDAADVAGALELARGEAGVDDKICVFGSFLTVSSALSATAS